MVENPLHTLNQLAEPSANELELLIQTQIGGTLGKEQNAIVKSLVKTLLQRREKGEGTATPLDVGETVLEGLGVTMSPEQLEALGPLLDQLGGMKSLSDPKALEMIKNFTTSGKNPKELLKTLLKREPIRNEKNTVGRNSLCACCGVKGKYCQNKDKKK